MSGQYPVTATVTPIFPSAQPTPQTVKNIGLVTVYLGSSSALSVSNGYALGPGSALSWEAGKALFAVTATGSATLSILDNGGALFDAAAVAAQIQISGAPPIDPLTTVASGTQASSGIGSRNTPAYVVPSINVANWQSVILRITDDTGGTAYASPQPRHITLIWADTANGPEVYRESFVVGDTNGQDPNLYFTTYQTSVKDAWLKIVFNYIPRASTLGWRVTGSYKTVVDPSYQYKSAYIPPYITDPIAGDQMFGEDDSGTSRIIGVSTSSALLQNNTIYNWYPSVISGAACLSHSIEGPGGSPIPSGGSLDAWVRPMTEYATPYPTTYMLKGYTGALPYFATQDFKLPFAPLLLMLRYSNSTAGTFQANVNLAIGIER